MNFLKAVKAVKAERLVPKVWFWPTVTFLGLAAYWTIWSLVIGKVPVISGLNKVDGTILSLPFFISRWWDLLFGPLIVLLIAKPVIKFWSKLSGTTELQVDYFAMCVMLSVVLSVYAYMFQDITQGLNLMLLVAFGFGLLFGAVLGVVEIIALFSKLGNNKSTVISETLKENTKIIGMLINTLAPLLLGIGLIFGLVHILSAGLLLCIGYGIIIIPAQILGLVIRLIKPKVLTTI